MNSFLILSRLQSGTEEVVRLDEALAAIAEEREACALLCENDTDDQDGGYGEYYAAHIRKRGTARTDGTGLERITVGDYTITHDLNGDYWIGHKSGEGMQVFRLNFEKLISVYYNAELTTPPAIGTTEK